MPGSISELRSGAPMRKYGPSMMVRVTGSSVCTCSVAVSAIVMARSSSDGDLNQCWQRRSRCRALTPQFGGSDAGALRERLELGPHDGWVDALRALALGKPAVCAGDHVLAPDQFREPN